MEGLHFMQEHPCAIFTNDDKGDYFIRNQCFIQSLKTMENLMDINAFIIDCQNKQILYATQECFTFFGLKAAKNNHLKFDFLDNYICPKEFHRVAKVNFMILDFFYSLPEERRKHCYSTHDFKLKKENYTTVMNLKLSVLDMTECGNLRLSLCVLNHYSIQNKPCNTYIKMLDTGTVYELIPSSLKFVEVKTQKLTSKANMIIKLASNGKTEAEIADKLRISVNTVKYHKKQIFYRIGVKNMAEAIQWANNQKKMIKMT
ncbi:helix-turn-helix transcriptional regulator [Parabacteroides sp. PF5-9]|uniref:helix-turn-helix domain-containing protein n=1 Tax=Parabacteroides sp. PF5-9 TaxID=1742404 RepID=UPI002476D6D7|nr:helix-turn-helix transcriptional regulator [Parabacteroides sp. PF5-9]MDH6356549.1 DNA-binding CsgD family transcriptional regulator [Parabacteroides sp. PF5-9]